MHKNWPKIESFFFTTMTKWWWHGGDMKKSAHGHPHSEYPFFFINLPIHFWFAKIILIVVQKHASHAGASNVCQTNCITKSSAYLESLSVILGEKIGKNRKFGNWEGGAEILNLGKILK